MSFYVWNEFHGTLRLSQSTEKKLLSLNHPYNVLVLEPRFLVINQLDHQSSSSHDLINDEINE